MRERNFGINRLYAVNNIANGKKDNGYTETS